MLVGGVTFMIVVVKVVVDGRQYWGGRRVPGVAKPTCFRSASGQRSWKLPRPSPASRGAAASAPAHSQARGLLPLLQFCCC